MKRLTVLLLAFGLVAAGSVHATRDSRLADLVLAGSDRPDPVKVGKRVTYALVLRNKGPNAASGVRLSGSVGRIGTKQGLVVLGLKGKGCRKLAGGGEESTVTAFVCAIRTMAARTRTVVTIAVRPTVAGSFRLGAVVSSATQFHSATLRRRRIDVRTTVNRR